MQAPDTPLNEALRLETLKTTGLLDSEREELFDSLTETVRLTFNVPICAFSLIDENRQWFKSIHGLEACETGRDVSFCGHVVYRDETLVIPDASKDWRFADNPLVTHDPFIRFYAGTPIRVEVFGETVDLGSLCIIDRRARTLSQSEIAVLEGFGRQVEALIQMHLVNSHLEQTCVQLQKTVRQLEAAKNRNRHMYALANTDSLTGVGNVRHFDQTLKQLLTRSRRTDDQCCLMLIDVDHFKTINDRFGHPVGDVVLQQLAKKLSDTVRLGEDHVFRLGGDEFAALLGNTSLAEAELLAARIIERLDDTPISSTESVSVSLGITDIPENETDQQAIVKRADRALYAAKQSGRHRFCVDPYQANSTD